MKPTTTLGLVWIGVALTSGLAAPLPETADNDLEFRLPQRAAYRLDSGQVQALAAGGKSAWLKAWPRDGSTNYIELGSRVVVRLGSENSPGALRQLKNLIAGHTLELARTITPGLFVLQAPDPLTAAQEAHRLAALPEVEAAYPVLRHRAALHGPYYPQPSDFFFSYQWPLEHRNGDGSSAGVDINVRAAWPYTLGEGVTIAVADSGVEMAHPELADRVAGAPHYNFLTQDTNAGPVGTYASAAHGTEVAGLAVASINNARMVGVAPGASLASWVVSESGYIVASDEELMEMYQYQSNVVSVQNHSWGPEDVTQQGPTLLEEVGISNAVSQGRFGRGVVMVRSAGNGRQSQVNANDNGYGSDPRAIGVAAVRLDGRAASYSNPGACVLVGAPSGDSDSPRLFTTDLLGSAGANAFLFGPPYSDLSDYVFDNIQGLQGFSGTSAAAPHITGIAALMLSVNPYLTYRDVQQILILSSRHFDFADPDLRTNGAGFVVSHNDGFGVPDAGEAVKLARDWENRPPMAQVTLTATNAAAIPDAGLRLLVSGSGVPAELASIECRPSTGPQADTPMAALPLVDFGDGTDLTGYNLTNKGALILRGADTFANMIGLAAQGGAAFAVVYNYDTNSGGGDSLTAMGITDFVPIPAVFIGNTAGIGLKALFQTNNSALAQINLSTTNYVFTVTNTMMCEQVGLRVMTDHPSRGELRITLVSPMGTRSVLQPYNLDTSAGPVDWTYYSTHHFFESTAGNWTACFSDQASGNTGAVQQVSLILDGVPIHDRDHDGLDDYWEVTYFDYLLGQGAKDDSDNDGYSNAREQLMGTDPTFADNLADDFLVDWSRWSPALGRLSWPGNPFCNYGCAA